MDKQREKGEGERHEESEIRKESAEMSRKEKRKAMKKLKRKQMRKEIAAKEREETEAKLNDPAEQERLKAVEEEEARIREKEIKDFEDSERAWREAMEIKKKKEEEEAKREEEGKRWKDLEELRKLEACGGDDECDKEDDGEYEYIEEGPPEIIFQGNEIILRKKKVRVLKKPVAQVVDRPTSNPLPPGTEVFPNYQNGSSAQHILDNVAQEVPNFGTEQDKAHCPFHLKTGTCRFGPRCSRVHFYPDKSCTLLLKNMYNGPGIAWEQDEGLEVCNRCHLVMLVHWWIPFSGGASVHDYNLIWVGVAVDFFYTEEEAERCYEEFYEDVHTEFLKFGELINFKVCRNGSFHLKGNVYVHYRSLESAMIAYQSINGRYFAGKQVNCEFVNISRWRVAICGEYIKSRLKTCSRGSACNFIHCFRNPGGDYEWADYDKPPPRFWIHKMTALFGYSDEYLQHMEREYSESFSDRRSDLPTDSHRQPSTRSKSRDHDHVKVVSKPSYRSHNNHGDTREESSRGHKLSRHDENSHDGDETSSRTRDGSSKREVYKERRYAKDTSHHESKWSEHSPGHRVIRKRIRGRYSDDDIPDADDYDRREMYHKRKARRGTTDTEVEEQVDDEKDIRTHSHRSSRKHRRKGSSADQEESHKHDKVHAVSDKLRRERSKHRHERSSSRYSHEEDKTRDSDRSRKGKRYQRSSVVHGSSGSSSEEERSDREETHKERSRRHRKRSSQHSLDQTLKESEDEVETDRWRPE